MPSYTLDGKELKPRLLKRRAGKQWKSEEVGSWQKACLWAGGKAFILGALPGVWLAT
jgi:hypothetical protein